MGIKAADQTLALFPCSEGHSFRIILLAIKKPNKTNSVVRPDFGRVKALVMHRALTAVPGTRELQ